MDKWSKGEENGDLKMNTKPYREKYDIHVAHLKEWVEFSPELTEKLRKNMFQRVL